MVQTLQQRLANEKFAKREEKKKGKPESALKPRAEKKQTKKSKISGPWLVFLAFAVFGSLAFEFIRLIWGWASGK